MKTLKFIQKNLIWLIPSSMLLGIFFGSFLNPSTLKASILPLTFLMIFPQMVNLDYKKLFEKWDFKLQSFIQSINFIVVPLFAFVLGKVFFSNSPFDLLGLLLIGVIPTGNMTLAWIGFNKGNLAAGIKTTIVGLLLGSLLAPFYLHLFVGEVVHIPLLKISKSIVSIIFIPLFAGFFVRHFLIQKYRIEKFREDIKPRVSLLSSLGVLGMVFVAMSLKSESILANPQILLHYILPLGIFYFLTFLSSTLIAKTFFKRRDSITLVYSTSTRNLAISLAVAMSAFGENGAKVALIVSVAYIFQTKIAALYSHFVEKFFGK